ncbi:MAG: hypothetical protein GY804_08350 [Alphaproteobacteria bacterium]|nr:hypothetical protein [Alphaproteobacteria bacterium]
MFEKIGIIYFSGTGNTKYIAKKIASKLKKQNKQVELIDMGQTVPENIKLEDYDVIGVGYPMHAFNPVKFASDFIARLPVESENKSKCVFIFQVTGGYDKPSNEIVKSFLAQKGYSVFYEDLFVMPSNIAVTSSAQEVHRLCKEADERALVLVTDVLAQKEKLAKIPVVLKVIYYINRAEYHGAKLLGKLLKADESKCNLCGKCVRDCPTKNISQKGEKIRFGWKCVCCMKCIYSCPTNAIKIRLLPFLKLKNGYNLEKIIASESEKTE